MNKHTKITLAVAAALVGMLEAHTSSAHGGPGAMETTVIYGRNTSQIGTSAAASEGVVGYKDFRLRPISRPGELVEVVPGVIATQHSGDGKANQYFLRGFNLDHGTDFSASVDGVPLNLRSHGHGQGYLDLNFVIPELVERVDYRKGPYRASTGDFSLAGSSNLQTFDRLERNFVQFTTGEFGLRRAVAGAQLSIDTNNRVIVGGEYHDYDGPWVLEQNLKKRNGLAKWVSFAERSQMVVTAMHYDNSWRSTDQIPEHLIRSGELDRFGFVDDDLGGAATRSSLALDYYYEHDDGANSAFNIHAVDYDFELFSNFTYFLENDAGDEFEQLDDRRYYGASFNHTRLVFDRYLLTAGLSSRFDDINRVGLYNTRGRERIATNREDSLDVASYSAFAEVELALSDNLRANIGGRIDHIRADVDALSDPANGGKASDSLASPSAGLAWLVSDSVELYANYGMGFHSNDARGATITRDPVSGESVDTVPLLVRGRGAELGVRYETANTKLSIALFSLDLDSELVFVGDAGTTEPNDGTERLGVEASAFWAPTEWLVADFSAGYTDASIKDAPGADHIPGAVEMTASTGVSYLADDWSVSVRLRHMGRAPLEETGTIESSPTTLVNVAGNYRWNNLQLTAEVLNLTDSTDADITYFYESRVTADADVVEGRHIHPVEPRQFRVSARWEF